MSFRFSWDEFTPAFHAHARSLLEAALNKGSKPPVLTDAIRVRSLDMGSTPPGLEIVEIGDLSSDRLRAMLKLTYAGDASVVLQTKVQANPLDTYLQTLPAFARPAMQCAASPLTIPLTVRLSHIRLSGIVVLVASQTKGCTVFFRNDPLDSIRVSSTFDGIPGMARYLQQEIEAQLRSLFREDLPAILHKLSLAWQQGGDADDKQVVGKDEQRPPRHHPDFDDLRAPDGLWELARRFDTLAEVEPLSGMVTRAAPSQPLPARERVKTRRRRFIDLRREKKEGEDIAWTPCK